MSQEELIANRGVMFGKKHLLDYATEKQISKKQVQLKNELEKQEKQIKRVSQE